MEAHQQNKLDGLQKLVALKEAEISALRLDLNSNTKVLQQSKDAIQQYKLALERQAAVENVLGNAQAELQQQLAAAQERARTAEERATHLASVNHRLEQVIATVRKDLIWLWKLNGGKVLSENSELMAENEEIAPRESMHAAIFRALEAQQARQEAVIVPAVATARVENAVPAPAKPVGRTIKGRKIPTPPPFRPKVASI